MSDHRFPPRMIWRSVSALLLTAVSLYFAFRQVALTEIIAAISSADPWWIAAAIGGMLLAHFSRALRWRAMLHSLKRVSAFSAFSSVMIGYGINQIVPRGGELVRPYVLGRREHLSASTLLATVVVERVIDVISLVLALLLSTWITRAHLGDALGALFHEGAMQEEVGAVTLTGLILRLTLPTIAGLLVLIWLFFTQRGITSLEWIAHRAPVRYHARLSATIGRFRDGLRIVRSSGQIGSMIVWTIGIWVGYGAMTSFPLYALHLEHYGLTFGDAFTLMSIITVGRSIAPTPGAIGVYHYFCIQGMVLLYHVSGADAAAFATLSHGVLYIAMIVIGVLLWLVEQMRSVQKPA